MSNGLMYLSQLITQLTPGLQPPYAVLFVFFVLFAGVVILANLLAIALNLILSLYIVTIQNLPRLKPRLSRLHSWLTPITQLSGLRQLSR